MLAAAYVREREDAERLALAQAHTLSQWVWAAFAGTLPAFEEVLAARQPLGSRAASHGDDEARTALSEAKWTDWWVARSRES